jgi:L-lactate utilization protein LutB
LYGPASCQLDLVLDGLAGSRDLPNACTMNGRCQEVCPVAIPLPTLVRAPDGSGTQLRMMENVRPQHLSLRRA